MNAASLLVLAVVVAIIAFAAWGTYRIIATRTYCSGCPNKELCGGGPINCTIKKN